jgi:hypothetical protein
MPTGFGTNPLHHDDAINASIPAYGFKRDYPIPLGLARVTASGLVLTATTSSTVPAIVPSSDDPPFHTLQWSAQATTAARASFNFTVPGEYNADQDQIEILAAFRKSGAEDAALGMNLTVAAFEPGITDPIVGPAVVPSIITPGNNTPVLIPTASAITRLLTARDDSQDGYNWYSFDLGFGTGRTGNANRFKPLQCLTLNLGPSKTLAASLVVDCAGLIARVRVGAALNSRPARDSRTIRS